MREHNTPLEAHLRSVDLTPFRSLVRERIGVRSKERERDKLSRFLAARMRDIGLLDIAAYLQLLQQGDAASRREWDEISCALTVGESYFFRDRGQIDLLRQHILPELIEANRSARRLRLWSAGCSTGEEVYSLAIMLDALLPNRDNWDIAIVGTDINARALARAREGNFGEWSFRTVDDHFKQSYFERRGKQWQIEAKWRNMVSFAPLNLRDNAYPNRALKLAEVDLIVCRNVFIYFAAETTRHIVAGMTKTMRPGGYLLTGHAEVDRDTAGKLARCSYAESAIFQRPLEMRVSTPAAVQVHPLPAAPAPPLRLPSPPPAPSSPTIDAAKPTQEQLLQDGRQKLAEGDCAGAIDTLQTVVANGEELEALCLLAHALASLGRHDEALDHCRRALAVDTLAAEPYYLMAHIAEEQGDSEAAKTHLKRVVYLQPERIAPYLELATIYQHQGDVKRARTMRNSALDLLQVLPPAQRVEPYAATAEEIATTLREQLSRND